MSSAVIVKPERMLYRFVLAFISVLLLTVICPGQTKSEGKCTPQASALFARMIEQPHDTMKAHICALIKGMVDSVIWDKLDCFYILAASDTNKANLNWIRNAHNLTPIGNMDFEKFRGYMGDGALSFIETNYNPLYDGVNYTLNSCGAGIYSRTDTYALGDVADMGSGKAAQYIWVNFKGTAEGLMRPYLNSSIASGSAFSYQGSTLGMITVNRTASDTVNTYTTTSTGSTARISRVKASSIPDFTIWISARNNGKAGTAYQCRQYAAAFIGGPLTLAQHNYLTTLIETYLDAVGAGVLP